MLKCRICKSRNISRHQVLEMMFGTREPFNYYECVTCGCLQISEYVEDIEEYYPDNYYSFNVSNKKASSIRRFAHKLNYYTSSLGISYRLKDEIRWLKKHGIGLNSDIHDIGCGGGAYLSRLYNLGFDNLSGSDPYIDQNIKLFNKINIYKTSIVKLDGIYDLITLNHVFEHLPNQVQTLKSIKKNMDNDGLIILRIPVVGEAWKIYSSNWVQIDAPRHYYLHTPKSLDIIAKQAGLYVDDLIYDSTGFQFWGSEQNLKGVPLMSEYSYLNNPNSSIFSEDELRNWEERASLLNKSGQGDQVVCFLKKCR